MAISFQAGYAQQTNTQTGTADVGTGLNRFLLLGFIKQGSATITTVTYGSQLMTNIATIATNSTVSSNEQQTLWGLINPASGSNTITTTDSDSHVGAYAYWGASYNGVDQVTGFEAANTNQNANAGSIAVTTLTNNDWVAGFFRTGYATTADANTAKRTADTNSSMFDSNKVVTPAGSYTIGTTTTGALCALACGLIPATVATSSAVATPLRSLLGVGL